MRGKHLPGKHLRVKQCSGRVRAPSGRVRLARVREVMLAGGLLGSRLAGLAVC